MTEHLTRSFRNGQLPELAALLKALDIDSRKFGDLRADGDRRLIRSPHRLVDAVSTAQLLIGAAAAQIWHDGTGLRSDIEIDTIDALHSLHASHYVWQQGAYFEVGAEYVQVNGFHPTRDDRQILLCAGPPYQKLLNGYLNFFDCGNNRASIDKATSNYTAEDLEAALSALGLPACRAFSPEEWRTHPQGKILSSTPVIEIEKLADGDPVPIHAGKGTLLDGVRVLDFTHVLAGPRSTQTLAEFGAEVLHISSPQHPDTLAQHLGVDMGKYCAYLDLHDQAQRERMHALAAHADVFASSYRTSVSDRFGLSPATLAARSRKGIVVMSVNAYGHAGVWADRGGFDPNGQAATGFASTEGGGVMTPALSPVFYLADLMSGYFAAAGMLAALSRRAREGGSYHVKVSLARSTMWVQDLGLLPASEFTSLPSKDNYPHRVKTSQTTYGEVKTLANPLRFSSLPVVHRDRLVPYGSDAAEWRTAG
ncbi:CoA transferase [Paraburkholderia sp. 22B1P]|uniref:CoA transferase n=1 Tax=Paraburkholderia sp. 22B1P TaxID=3080498 RepID=UPI003087A40E|nr:CoA transferase [Paraburkholderia sp. 22B1P]